MGELRFFLLHGKPDPIQDDSHSNIKQGDLLAIPLPDFMLLAQSSHNPFLYDPLALKTIKTILQNRLIPQILNVFLNMPIFVDEIDRVCLSKVHLESRMTPRILDEQNKSQGEKKMVLYRPTFTYLCLKSFLPFQVQCLGPDSNPPPPPKK